MGIREGRGVIEGRADWGKGKSECMLSWGGGRGKMEKKFGTQNLVEMKAEN